MPGWNWNRRDGIVPSGALSAVITVLFVAAQAHAGEIEPRTYINTPVGINSLLAGYAYSEGSLSTVGSSPIKDSHLRIHTGVLAYARSMDVWGKSGKFDVILPYSQLSRNYSIKMCVSSGVHTNIGIDCDLVGILCQYR